MTCNGTNERRKREREKKERERKLGGSPDFGNTMQISGREPHAEAEAMEEMHSMKSRVSASRGE